MNAIVKGRVFKSGNSAAVRLPKELGFRPGTEVTLEQSGDTVTIRPVENKAAIRRDLEQLAEDLRAIWANAPYREVEKRGSDIFPDRPGLY